MSGAISTGAKNASHTRLRADPFAAGRLCVAGNSGLVANTRVILSRSEDFRNGLRLFLKDSGLELATHSLVKSDRLLTGENATDRI